MTVKDKLSRTMRIDLIPDTSSEPVLGKKKRVEIAVPTGKHPRVQVDAREKDSHYQELLQSVYDAALITDLSGKITDVNMRAVEFLQYERSELCGLSVFDIISGADKSLIQDIWQNLQETRFAVIEAFCFRSDGSLFPSEIAVNKLSLDEVRLCFFVRDITVRRQKEEMLRTTYNAIQNSGNGIAITDLNGILEYVNPAVAVMWGYETAIELTNRDARDLFSDKKAADEMIGAVQQEDRTWINEMKGARNGQGEFDVQISAACNRNTDGEPVGIVFSFVDISDHKQLEEAMRQAERNRVMMQSMGAACHHLGQPATVLLANLGILEKRLLTDDALINELVRASIEAAERLADTLHKLNEVNEYKTTRYLDKMDGADSHENRIVEI